MDGSKIKESNIIKCVDENLLGNIKKEIVDEEDTEIYNDKSSIRLRIRNTYECNFCNQKFSNKSNWQLHLQSHIRKMPLKCNYCDKVFASQLYLKKHENTHLKEKKSYHKLKNKDQYSCNLCSKIFYSEVDIISHMSHHPSAMPCICKTCGKGFLKKANLKSHVRTHKKQTNNIDSNKLMINTKSNIFVNKNNVKTGGFKNMDSLLSFLELGRASKHVNIFDDNHTNEDFVINKPLDYVNFMDTFYNKSTLLEFEENNNSESKLLKKVRFAEKVSYSNDNLSEYNI